MPGLAHDHSIHRIAAEHGSYVWDNSLPPALEVESGETVELECADASGGQLSQGSTARDVETLDLTKVNPVTGPVYVKGAKPGDVLAVEILELKPHDWGWTAIIPDFGLLAPEFSCAIGRYVRHRPRAVERDQNDHILKAVRPHVDQGPPHSLTFTQRSIGNLPMATG